VPIALYPLAKRVTDWPQAVLGFVFSWAAPTGYAAATGGLDAAAFALWAAAFFWILGYDTIYAHQDREDDAMVGIRSTARKFAESSRPFLAACYGATLVLLAVAGWLAGLSWAFCRRWRCRRRCWPGRSRRSTSTTRRAASPCSSSNREAGLLVALAFLAGRL
jgi:4-hydroxybenzoate polyprenyltransferase